MRTPSRRIITILICFSSFINTRAGQIVDEDSILNFPNNQFFKDYWQKGYTDLILSPPFGYEKAKSLYKINFNDFRFVQTNKNLYLTLNNTGKVFELMGRIDSILTFKRIDKTVNQNYNIGAFNFPYLDNIYSYSGYGFWQTSGLLRNYNFKVREWDIVKVDKEIIPQLFPSPSIWFDPEHLKLYVLFQRTVNQGLKDNEFVVGKIEDDSYCLNLQNNNWEYIGKANAKVVNIFKIAGSVLNGNKGLIVATTDHEVFWIDLINNQGYKLTDVNQEQTLLKLFNNSFCYLHDSTVYFYHFDRKEYDSIKIEINNKVTSFPIFMENQNLNKVSPYFLLVFTLPVIIILIQLRRKKLSQKKSEELFVQSSSVDLEPLEKNLIDLLIGKKGAPASIQEVNYVLGLKNKNIGLQKKVRSDVINSINEKYFKISGNKALLIQSIRSEDDKRIFEYIIDMNRAVEILGK